MHGQQNIKIHGTVPARKKKEKEKKKEKVPLHAMVHKWIGQGEMCQLGSIFFQTCQVSVYVV